MYILAEYSIGFPQVGASYLQWYSLLSLVQLLVGMIAFILYLLLGRDILNQIASAHAATIEII